MPAQHCVQLRLLDKQEISGSIPLRPTKARGDSQLDSRSLSGVLSPCQWPAGLGHGEHAQGAGRAHTSTEKNPPFWLTTMGPTLISTRRATGACARFWARSWKSGRFDKEGVHSLLL